MSRHTFASELIEALPSPAAKLTALALLRKYAGCTIYLPQLESRAERRIGQATNMIKNGMAPADVGRVLRERFGISGRTAHRDVTAALRKLSCEGGTAG